MVSTIVSLIQQLPMVHLQVDKEGGINMEDAAGFFANVFGGERFMDYVRRLTFPSGLSHKIPFIRLEKSH